MPERPFATRSRFRFTVRNLHAEAAPSQSVMQLVDAPAEFLMLDHLLFGTRPQYAGHSRYGIVPHEIASGAEGEIIVPPAHTVATVRVPSGVSLTKVDFCDLKLDSWYLVPFIGGSIHIERVISQVGDLAECLVDLHHRRFG